MIKTKRLNIYPASDEQMESLIAKEPVPELKAAYQEMLDGSAAHPDERLWYVIWMMELNDGTGAIIGNLSFKGITEDGMVEIGYGTEPEYEGRGYMTEAVAALVEWAEDQPCVCRVEAETESDNPASQRVLEKTGFVPTGICGEEGPRFVHDRSEKIEKMLFELRDEEYAQFQAKLTPTLSPDLFIGVRVPEVRKLAKQLISDPDAARFLKELPHRYYDENMLHGLLVSEMKDYGEAIEATDRFLPYIDNWAVCDIMSPKVFKKHKGELLEKIKEWTASDKTYTIRFGIEMLMSHFLDDDFKAEYLDIVAALRSGEYYVNMMIAWFFATALTKQWDSTISYIEGNRLDKWTHNKTIQKAIESYRITDEQKKYLRTMKL